MRLDRRRTRWITAGLAAAALLALAGSAGAQMVVDGNVFFENNASGTLAGQGVGVAGAGAPACPAGLSAGQLLTVTYTHNQYADPLLPLAVYQPNTLPNFQPTLGSPAYGSSVVVPNDGFFTQTCYDGAIGPLPQDNWVKYSTWANNPSPSDLSVPNKGWVYYDSTGAHRHDLHLASNGDPNPRPVVVYDNTKLYTHMTWSADSNYLVRGQFRIKSQASLTVPAGTVIFEEFATLGTMIVERGGQIFAVGTEDNPIIMTSDDAPGFMTRGHCGGLVINGYGKTNVVNSCAGDSAASEGGAIGYYGGNDDNDNSGTLRYFRIEYSGKEITPNNELNSFTFNSCGNNTHGDYLEAFFGADDSFEWFGGTMDQKYLIGIDGTDDGYDWQLGTRNRAQFVIVRQAPIYAPAGDQNGDKGIEADDNEFDFNATVCSGRSNCTIANMTAIGDHRVGASFPGPTSGINLRRGTEGTVLNSIYYEFKTAGLKVDDDATWQAHCLAPPAAPALYCPGALSVGPVGAVFVTHSTPNPFHDRVSLLFSLPQAGHVTVEIYSADGRQVATLVNGPLAAGPQRVTWNLGRETPAGMYFYRVRTEAGASEGKIARVD